MAVDNGRKARWFAAAMGSILLAVLVVMATIAIADGRSPVIWVGICLLALSIVAGNFFRRERSGEEDQAPRL